MGILYIMTDKSKLNNAYVYIHKRLDNDEIFYVGIGFSANFSRAYSYSNRNKYWYNIKIETSIKIIIVYKNLTWAQACKKEIKLIKLIGRQDLKQGTLCNMTSGGEGFHNISQESRKKISNANKGKKASNVTKEKLRLSHIGQKLGDKNPMKLLVNRLKISKFMTENNPMKSKKVSEITKKKISIATTNSKLGKPLSKSHCLNIATSKQRKILNISTGVIYESLMDCAIKNNMTYGRISNILQERIKPRGLFIKRI